MTDARLLVVDRANAFAWLSRGVVVPPSAMSKYRPDGLHGGPRLGFVDASLCATMAAQTTMPVAMELDDEVQFAETDADASGIVWARGAVSVTRFPRIHVSSEEARQELQARAYRGFDAAKLAVSVSPQLFEGAAPAGETLREGISEDVDDVLLRRREAVAGALCCVRDAGLIRDVVNSSTSDPFEALVENLRERAWLADAEESTLFHQMLSALHALASEGEVVASSIIEAVRGLPSSSEASGMPAALDRIEEILRGESEMRRFRGGGQRPVKALLLYLLRPAPEELLAWDVEETGADTAIAALASTLAGAASRFGGLPQSLREAVGETERAGLLDWVAAAIQPTDLAWPTRSKEETADEPEPDDLRQALKREVAQGKDGRALTVAQTLKWTECLAIAVVAESVDVSTQGRRVRAAFPAGAEVEWFLDVDAFIGRLDATDEGVIAAAMEGRRARARSSGTSRAGGRSRTRKDS